MKRLAAARTTLKIRDNKIKFFAIAIAMKWLVHRPHTQNEDMKKAVMVLQKARPSIAPTKIDEFSIEQAKSKCANLSKLKLVHFESIQ